MFPSQQPTLPCACAHVAGAPPPPELLELLELLLLELLEPEDEDEDEEEDEEDELPLPPASSVLPPELLELLLELLEELLLLLLEEPSPSDEPASIVTPGSPPSPSGASVSPSAHPTAMAAKQAHTRRFLVPTTGRQPTRGPAPRSSARA